MGIKLLAKDVVENSNHKGRGRIDYSTVIISNKWTILKLEQTLNNVSKMVQVLFAKFVTIIISNKWTILKLEQTLDKISKMVQDLFARFVARMEHLALDFYHQMEFSYKGKHSPLKFVAMVAMESIPC